MSPGRVACYADPVSAGSKAIKKSERRDPKGRKVSKVVRSAKAPRLDTDRTD